MDDPPHGRPTRWETKGNIVELEFTIEDGQAKVGEASKKRFRAAGTYGIEVAPATTPFSFWL